MNNGGAAPKLGHMLRWGVDHRPTPEYIPQGNGMDAEAVRAPAEFDWGLGLRGER
jgi:hypothetical protein